MKAKDQLLNFINLIFAILLISFFIYFFILPGNFEKFQTLLLSFAPLIFMAVVLIIKIKLTSAQIGEQRDFLDDNAFVRLTYWDKIKLEIILTGLPIVMIVWTVIFNLQNWQTIGSAVVVFLVNTAVLHSIFKKRASL